MVSRARNPERGDNEKGKRSSQLTLKSPYRRQNVRDEQCSADDDTDKAHHVISVPRDDAMTAAVFALRFARLGRAVPGYRLDGAVAG